MLAVFGTSGRQAAPAQRWRRCQRGGLVCRVSGRTAKGSGGGAAVVAALGGRGGGGGGWGLRRRSARPVIANARPMHSARLVRGSSKCIRYIVCTVEELCLKMTPYARDSCSLRLAAASSATH